MGTNITRTKANQAKDNPHPSLQRNAAVLHASLDSIILLDERGLILEWNPAAESTFGLPRSDAVGRELVDLIIAPALRAACGQSISQSLRAGHDGILGQQLDVTAIRASGEEFPAGLAITRLPDMNPPVFCAFLRDNSRRVMAEQALRESEQRFSLFMTHLPGAAFIKDGEDRVVFVNEAHKKIMGWSADDWEGKTSVELFPSDLAAEFATHDRQVRQTLQPMKFIEQIPHQDGNHQYLVSKFPILVGEGKKPMLGGIAIDFTELHRAEEAIRYQKVLLESVNNASPDGLLVVSPDGKWLSYNGRFLEMWGIDADLGRESDEPVLRAVQDKVKDPQAFLDRIHHLYSHPNEQAFDDRIELKDGRVLSRSSSPVVGADGTHYGRVWFFHDRTAEEHAQHRLLALASELTFSEERERQRIAHILHDGVVQLLGMSQMKLRSIDSNSPEAATVTAAMEHIAEALNYTRMLTVELNPPILYDRGLVPAIEWLTKRAALRSDIDIAFSDDGQTKPIKQQFSIMLFHAVQELLTNMAKHSKATRGEVKVVRSGDELRIIIQDNGVGFDPGALRRRQEENDCFGLYSTQERLRFLGGRLRWESQVGAGAKFIIETPLQPAQPT